MGRIPGGGSPIIVGRMPIPIIPPMPGCIIIGGGGIPCMSPGPIFEGGGMATPVLAGGGAWAKGFEAILPALNAAVVASMRFWAWSWNEKIQGSFRFSDFRMRFKSMRSHG